jgi:hypothetical protein
MTINDLLNRLLKVEAELEDIGAEFDDLTAACDGELFPEQGGLAADLENLLIAATHETATGIGFQRQDIADLYAFIEFRKRHRQFSDQQLEQIIDSEIPSAELKQQLLKRIGEPKELLRSIKSVRQDWNNSFKNRKYCVIRKSTKT